MTDQDLDEFLGAKPKPAWHRHAKWAAAALGAVFLLVLAFGWFDGTGDVQYATVQAKRGRLVTTVSATGKLAPTNQVTVGSQLSGQITRVLVDVNDRVAKGQVLAEIDPEQIDAQIRQSLAQLAASRAQVDQARATLAEAQAQLARLEEVYKLSGGRVPSATELQTARANVQRAQASLKTAQANVVASEALLAQNRTQRARAVIRSPVSGVVLARQVDPGQTVAASFNTPTLFVIAEDLSKMKLEVSIDEADVGQVREGQQATFTVDAFPGRTFPATITRVAIGSNLSADDSGSSSSSASGSGQVVSYAADLSVANERQELRPGMTATANIVTSDRKNVLLIPNAALRFTPRTPGADGEEAGGITGALSFRPPRRDNGQRATTIERGATQTVYVRGDDGRPRAVEIVTGNTNGSQTEVVSGDLKEGMEVITGLLSGAGGGAAPQKGSGGG